MAEEDAPKRMTSAEKKAALLEKYDINKDGKLDSEEKVAEYVQDFVYVPPFFTAGIELAVRIGACL